MSRIDVANMSIAARPGSESDQEVIDTEKRIKALLRAGISVVVAAGNFGPLIGTTSPFVKINNVISVGATKRDESKLAIFSSRGFPNNKETFPTVVTLGEDILIDCKSYNENTLSMDKSLFRRYIKQQNPNSQVEGIINMNNYMAVSGTSFACCTVGAYVGMVIKFRKELGLYYDPKIIKEIIELMAVPIDGYREHEIGKGYIDINTIESYFKGIDSTVLSDYYWGNNKKLFEKWKKLKF